MAGFWRVEARRVADKLIIQRDPEHFLAGEFARKVPAAKIAAWLDFVHNDEKGMGWVDECGQNPRPNPGPGCNCPR